ncbi:MAG: tRNA (guanosine(46)-N7)-methyltransferase TrmB [Evtepia sp.]
MRMRKKKNLRPRMENCSIYWIQKPEEMRGKWLALMPEARAVFLEIGCGKGRFTCETASENPDILFVAIERVPEAMIVGMERARNMDLHNVFYIDGDARELEKYFAAGELSRIYINFCDPWSSQSYARRRLTHTDFLSIYRPILIENGEIHFKTDNSMLFEYSLFQFPKLNFTLHAVTRDLHAEGVQGVMTDYEEKFHTQGIPICRCIAKKEA